MLVPFFHLYLSFFKPGGVPYAENKQNQSSFFHIAGRESREVKSLHIPTTQQTFTVLKVILTVGEKGKISAVTEGKAIKCSMDL